MQRVTAYRSFDKRKEIVVRFDLEAGIFLANDLDVERAVSRDSSELPDVALLRDAFSGAFNVRAETVMATSEQNRQQYNQSQQLFHDGFSFAGCHHGLGADEKGSGK